MLTKNLRASYFMRNNWDKLHSLSPVSAAWTKQCWACGVTVLHVVFDFTCSKTSTNTKNPKMGGEQMSFVEMDLLLACLQGYEVRVFLFC
jgi:hypothetical protein